MSFLEIHDVTPIRQKTPAIVRTDAVQQNGILTKKEEKKYSTKLMEYVEFEEIKEEK